MASGLRLRSLETPRKTRQADRQATTWLRLHQVAREDLKGGWVTRGNHPHELSVWAGSLQKPKIRWP